MILETPTMLRLGELAPEQVAKLQRLLTYTDLRVDQQIARHKRNAIQYKYYKTDQYQRTLDELKEQRVQSLLFEDEKGYWTYSGFKTWLEGELNQKTEVQVEYPEPKIIPWDHKPQHEPRWYQSEAVSRLTTINHGSLQLATGLGKSLIISMLCKHYALPTVVMAPNLSIAGQLLKDLTYHFGKKHVGQLFNGKKEVKLFTVAVSKSLTMVLPDSPLWEKLQETQVFIADESHLCPADTLQAVCLNLFANVPYRYFLSGTQTRTDGLEKVLGGIIGDIVIEMDVKQGVTGGFLSRPKFFVLRSSSATNYQSDDPAKMMTVHFYKNQYVYEQAGKLANRLVKIGKRVLILIDEVHQFPRLLPHLEQKCGFAHGPLNEDNRRGVPTQYWKSDSMALVSSFDNGDFPVLVGTSCIGTGTDIKSVSAIIDLVGGKSEIRVRQAVGRGTRLFPGKTDCLYFDFDIENVQLLHKHCEYRVSIYEDIYGPVQYMG